MASKVSVRAYATPLAFRAAVETRLRRGTSGASFQRRRQIFVFGRFIARLISHFGDRIIVKGGLALELRLKRARTTKDIDFAIFGETDQLLQRLQAVGQLDLQDFMSFEVAPDGEIDGEGVIYGGHHFRIHCRLGGQTYLHFPVDVVFGGAMLGAASTVEYRDDLSFVGIPPPQVKLLPVATHIAEKVHAYTLPRPTTNFRVRDLPDMALLATVGEPLALSTIRDALSLTFKARNTHSIPASLPLPPPSWERDYVALAVENELIWTSITEVFAAVRGFVEPALAEGYDATWNPNGWLWERDV